MARPALSKGVSFREDVHYMLDCKTTGVESLTTEDEAWAKEYRQKRTKMGVDERPSWQSVSTTAQSQQPHDVALERQASKVSDDLIDIRHAMGSPLDDEHQTTGKQSRSNSQDSTCSTSSQSSGKLETARALTKRALLHPLTQLNPFKQSATERQQHREERRQSAEADRLDRELREHEHRARRRQVEQDAREAEIRSMQGLERERTVQKAGQVALDEAAKLQRELRRESETDVKKDQAWSGYNDRQRRLKALRTEREEAARREKATQAKALPQSKDVVRRFDLLPSPKGSWRSQSGFRLGVKAGV